MLNRKLQKVGRGSYSDPLSNKGTAILSHLQQINQLNIVLFTPALLVSKIAFSLSPGMQKRLFFPFR